MVKTFELRQYQVEQIKRVIRELIELKDKGGVALLASAVGSGKTTVTKIIINEVIKPDGLGIKKVIISSPFLTIAKDFEAGVDDQIWTSPSNQKYNISSYIVGGNSIKFINCDSTKEMKRILRASSYDPCSFSHSSLANTLELVSKPEVTFANTLLVIDEAHHCFHDEEDDSVSGTNLGKVVNKAIEKGAKVLYLTATPYRTEGSKTIPIVDTDVCNPIVRTIGEQIKDGFSPSLDVEYIKIKGDYEFMVDKCKHEPTIVDGPNTIFGSAKKGLIYAEHVYDQWVKEGCPKAIIVIPGGESIKTADVVKAYFIKRGFPPCIKNRGRAVPSILDAVGDNKSDRERILYEIRDDKKQNGRKYDLVIGCRRFDEGTDVPSASHVYMIGVPGNVRIYHQRAGRVLRNKKSVAGYSEWFGDRWLDKAKAVFFIPLFQNYKELGNQVARQLLHCIFVGENYQAYCNSVSTSIEFKKAIEDHLKDAVGDHAIEVENVLRVIDSSVMYEEINKSKRIMDLTIEVKKNPNITVKEFCVKALEGVTDPVEKLAIQTALVENIKGVTVSDVKKLAGDVVQKSVSASSKKSKEDSGMALRPLTSIFQEEMGLAFNLLISKFGRKKVELKSEVYVDRVMASLTSEDLSYWTKQCEFFYDNEELSNETCRKVCEWKDSHKGKNPCSVATDNYERRLGQWLGDKKKAKSGKGSQTFYPSDLAIAEFYKYPDLFEIRDLEELSNDLCRKVCEWKDSHNGNNPRSTSTDVYERSLGYWLGDKKKAKSGRSSKPFYPSDLAIAESYKYPDLFEIRDLEELSNDMCRKVCEWKDSHKGKNPCSVATDDYERSLGIWLGDKKKAKSGKISNPFYPSDLAIAESYKYPDLFEIRDLEELSNDMCRKVCEWKDSHNGENPNKNSKDDYEKSLNIWLGDKKKAKSGKISNPFYPSDLAIAESYKYPDLFEIRDLEELSNDMCRKVCEWKDSHNGENPNKRSKDDYEKSLGIWLGYKKGAKSSRSSKPFYPSDLAIAESYRYPDLFEIMDLEELSNDMCRKVCEWMDAHGGMGPRSSAKDKYEKKLSIWLHGKKNSKSVNKSIRGRTFYPSDLAIAKTYKYPNLFEMEGLEEQSNKKCREVCEWMNAHGGKSPSKGAIDTYERGLGEWVGNKRQTLLRKKRPFYSSDLAIAKDYGYPKLFETKW